jgi:hypothetical protein
MAGFWKKNKLAFDIIFLVVALAVSALHWYQFATTDNKWYWLGGFIFAVNAIIKAADLIEYLRKRKNKMGTNA